MTFPALLATGISPVVATASNTVALTPGNLLAVLYDRSQLPPLGRSFAALVAASLARRARRAACCCWSRPSACSPTLIPLLLGFATVLFAFAGRISAWLRARATDARRRGRPNWSTMIGWLLPVSVYGGYFGAGLGVLVLGVVSVGTGGDYRSANVTKNLVVFINSVVVAAFFAVQAIVAWPQALVMMAGVPLGAAARLAHRAGAAERDGALAGGRRRGAAHGRLCVALLVLNRDRECSASDTPPRRAKIIQVGCSV